MTTAIVCAWAAATLAAAAADGPRVRVAGAQRARYESLDPQFRSAAGLDRSDRALALRTQVELAASAGRFGATLEIMDSRLELNDRGSPNTMSVNALEPLQAFASLAHSSSAGGAGAVRVGRMTLDLGKRRLIARNAFRNSVNSFAGIDWQWRGARDLRAQAFWLRPMRILPNGSADILANEQELDRAARDVRVRGGLVQGALHGGPGRIEGYAVDFRNGSSADLQTFGVRAFRQAERAAWLYDVEAALQRGRSTATVAGATVADLSHRASLVQIEAGRTFGGRRAPSVRLLYDRASGDRDPLDARNERFDTVFGARRFDFGPTGIFGPFARANLESAGVRFAVDAATRVRVLVDYRAFRLASATDTWVTTGRRDPLGQSGRSLGRQLDASMTWQALPRRLSVEAGVAVFRQGRFAREAPGAHGLGDPLYFYAALTTTFGGNRRGRP